jgi:3-oxoadipyl-CoA thiolase
MRDVYICDAIRTPIGRFGGGLAAVRADDLAAVPIKALMERNPSVDWNAVDEVFLGCANQAGEDNRNVARMALLLAGLPESVPGVTLNRLCASGMDAIGTAFRAIASGEMELAIAGGVESMSRAPFVMGKADAAFSRNMKLEDTTIGWRFINPLMKAQYGVDAMPQTADNVADDYKCPAPTRTPSPCAASNARLPRPPAFRRRNRRSAHRPQEGRNRGQPGRASARRHHPGSPGQTQAGQWPGQDRHRRQRLGRERRCGGADLASAEAVKNTA